MRFPQNTPPVICKPADKCQSRGRMRRILPPKPASDLTRPPASYQDRTAVALRRPCSQRVWCSRLLHLAPDASATLRLLYKSDGYELCLLHTLRQKPLSTPRSWCLTRRGTEWQATRRIMIRPRKTTAPASSTPSTMPTGVPGASRAGPRMTAARPLSQTMEDASLAENG